MNGGQPAEVELNELKIHEIRELLLIVLLYSRTRSEAGECLGIADRTIHSILQPLGLYRGQPSADLAKRAIDRLVDYVIGLSYDLRREIERDAELGMPTARRGLRADRVDTVQRGVLAAKKGPA